MGRKQQQTPVSQSSIYLSVYAWRKKKNQRRRSVLGKKDQMLPPGDEDQMPKFIIITRGKEEYGQEWT